MHKVHGEGNFTSKSSQHSEDERNSLYPADNSCGMRDVSLPINQVLPKLSAALHTSSNVVLVAPPGAGKTTCVPLALLQESWLADQRIVMLEPRRLAARTAARFMAASLGERVGESVGYRVKMETRVGPRTRVEVVTEGVLTRLLQADPALEGVGLVIFDEFHERNLHSDLGLALTLQSQSILRDDLRVLVMSATLDVESVVGVLGEVPVIKSEGQSYPVQTHYLERPAGDRRLEGVVASAVVDALEETSGDVLVFLPGMGEIRRVMNRLAATMGGALKGVRLAALHGSLSQTEQDAAIAPSSSGERKVVLATNIAESSLTVEGVRVVIDSGLARVPRFSPRTGMTRLETIPVAADSADQRRGRAGRLGPGVCYRLWTESEHRARPGHSIPEILQSDLASLALELAVWGVRDPDELLWIDTPPRSAYEQAVELLRRLDALTKDGAVTEHGRNMAAMGLHPRLAHMILRSAPLGLGRAACELAALLSNRDLLRSETRVDDVDMRLRLEALHAGRRGETVRTATGMAWVDPAVRQATLAEAQNLMEKLPRQARGAELDGDHGDEPAHCGLLVAFAYPDRIAQRRPAGGFLLSNGRGAIVSEQQPLQESEYLAVAELDDRGANSRIVLAAPITLTALEQHFQKQIEVESNVAWDSAAQAVRARRLKRLGALVLNEKPLTDPEPDAVSRALLEGIASQGLGILPWTKGARQLQQRLIFMHAQQHDWPDVRDAALTRTLTEWLGPFLVGMSGKEDLQHLNLVDILQASLSWEQRQRLEVWAPTHFQAPSGSRIPIDYSDPERPAIAVRLQELFGLQETPGVGQGRVPLSIQLLSPAQRPVQVTQDLASFWREAYFEVRKELKGRYPKHPWPEDPLTAEPTRRTRGRR